MDVGVGEGISACAHGRWVAVGVCLGKQRTARAHSRVRVTKLYLPN